MSSRGGHRTVIALACAAAAIGASFEGCFAFSDLQGGAGSGASADAMIDTGADAASSDTFVPDAIAPVDAAPGIRFCSTQIDAAFCDDFDQIDAAPLSLWQAPSTNNGSSVTLTTAALSLPNALLVTTVADGNTTLIPANISHQLSGTAATVRYVYDLLVDFSDGSGSNAYISPMDERVGVSDTELRLILGNTGMQFSGAITPGDGGATTYPNFGPKTAVSSSVWHHVEIDADYSQSPAVTSFIFDGTTIVDHASVPGATFGVGALTVEAGFLYVSSPTTGWKIRIDNVAVFTE